MTKLIPEDLTPGTGAPVSLEPGDICIAATWQVGEVNIRRNSGDCRVLVYSRDMTLKGALWTGETGLVLGVEYCPKSQTLLVSDAASRTLHRFSAAGELLTPFPAMQGKPFGPIAATGDGGIVVGEHLYGDAPPFLGGGEIYCFNSEGALMASHAAQRDPGKFGFHGVTNMALTDNGQTAIYISETGKRVMRYNLAQGRQLPDLFSLAGESTGDGGGNGNGNGNAEKDMVTAGISLLGDGNILIAHVYGAGLFSPGGEMLKTYDIPNQRGWAAIRASADGSAFFLANFFTGRLEKRNLRSGDIIKAVETGMIFKLACIAEIT